MIDEPCVQARTMFVDTSGVSAVDFRLSRQKQLLLLGNGEHAARKFLRGWSFPRYLKKCRGGAS